MLSECIDSLASHLGRYADTGMTLEPEAVDNICGLLAALADDARSLEACLVPPTARLTDGDLPDNVVPLTFEPRHPRRHCGAGASGGGGDAA